MKNANKPIAAAILFVIGMVLSVMLKVSMSLSESSFLGLAALTVLSSFLVYFGDRVTFADLTRLRFKMQRVEAAEASVKAVASALLDVIEMKSHAIMTEGFDREAYDAAVEKLKRLIS